MQLLRVQNCISKWSKSCILGGSFFTSDLSKNFLRILCYHPRYVKCSPNVALSAQEKITVIRCVDQKISLQKHKNRVFFAFEGPKLRLKMAKKLHFWGSFLTSDLSKKFSTHPMLSSKVCKMFS